ncbi:MAG: S-adenosylmethionine decarboxylase [Myxococcales bacterium]|nr:S-adenosylmethionine decarboxylase [Myxococcales bacterium]
MTARTHRVAEFRALAGSGLAPELIAARVRGLLPAALAERVVCHEWQPQGLSLMCFSTELTFTLHTWPEHGACVVDVFHCPKRFDGAAFLRDLRAQSGWALIAEREFPRSASGR